MYSNEIIMSVLKALYFEHKPIQQIADTYKMHRNTIRNIARRYRQQESELEKIFLQGKIEEKRFMKENMHSTRKKKITEEHKKAIQEYCKKHLNCQRLKNNPEQFFRDLCERYGVRFRDVICYNPDSIVLSDDEKPKNCYLKSIRKIRNSHSVIKNYEEVYGVLCSCKVFKEHPISYSTFYRYAKDFWKNEDDVLNGKSFGEYLDKNYHYLLSPH